jgi:hypothetical protein
MSSDGGQRTERPLGRGLEDVSHLFLSRQREEREEREGAAVLRAAEPITREKLRLTLRECQGALEANLRTIDACIPCGPVGNIDLLAVDAANRLVVIDIESTPSDALLLRGGAHLDWLGRHQPLLQHIYSASAIDFSWEPRLVFVAPGFSSLLLHAVRSLAGRDIACFRYHSVKISTGTGIFFEQVGRDGS